MCGESKCREITSVHLQVMVNTAWIAMFYPISVAFPLSASLSLDPICLLSPRVVGAIISDIGSSGNLSALIRRKNGFGFLRAF